uniref:chymotrypsin-like protease CTRL-1 isoform X2 n=1 Tax=Panthera onca TaxID=9690 RepID=UPI0029551138|nr:chymotrypsin-like protease CTRL-1 isoform X2 [Panthera onca]
MQCQAPGPGRCPCRIAVASTFAVVPSSASPGWSLLPIAKSCEYSHSAPLPSSPVSFPWMPFFCCSALPAAAQPHSHCSPGRHFVVLGEYDRSSNAEPLQVLSISKAITHPFWNPTTLNNDLTLLKLASPAQYTKRITPVCLASPNEALPAGLTCVTTGWGRLSGVGNVTPARLQQVALPLVTVSQCRQYWGSRITDSMICAGGSGASSCQVSNSTLSYPLAVLWHPLIAELTSPLSFPQGDSGGPLVCQKGNTWVLIGVVSWGTSNCNVHKPAIYTRVSKFSTWINQIIAYN